VLLAAYPHVAHCPDCRAYLSDQHHNQAGPDLVWATLAHHDSGHRHDPLTAASEYV
jgi:hypothetical protein